VAEDDRLMGLITLARVRAVPKDKWPSLTVADAMVPLSPAIVVAPDDTMADTMTKLNGSEIGRVLVTHGDRLLGIISQADVARWLERERLREEVAPVRQ
ncbi:MAG: CBS domain-containing protein, partial [Longimicrobiales bacterium]